MGCGCRKGRDTLAWQLWQHREKADWSSAIMSTSSLYTFFFLNVICPYSFEIARGFSFWLFFFLTDTTYSTVVPFWCLSQSAFMHSKCISMLYATLWVGSLHSWLEEYRVHLNWDRTEERQNIKGQHVVYNSVLICFMLNRSFNQGFKLRTFTVCSACICYYYYCYSGKKKK